MMVIFVSQCEKKAHPRTRRVLDAFADRIGDNTWQTVITQEGLLAVKKLLRKTASKNTAVSCHWIRARSRTELVWVVGNKSKFNARGIVPVNSTAVHSAYRDDLADWHYLPVIQSLTSLAALLHDWGKANARFQEKLDKNYKGKQGDALRHEWVSCLLLKILIESSGSNLDQGWLSLLADGKLHEEQFSQVDLQKIQNPLSNLPPIAQMVSWLIVTHHRMPLQRLRFKELSDVWKGEAANHIEDLFVHISQDWGYWNESAQGTLKDCLHFPYGLLVNSSPWIKALKRWARKLLEQQLLIEQIMSQGSYRLILHHSRLCLMLGDHYYSSLSLKESGEWKSIVKLIANTQKDGSPKQILDQHLVGVYQQAKRNVGKLPQLEKGLPVTNNIAALKKKSTGKFNWQDVAARKVYAWTSQQKEKKNGFFAVNMASTGCGKTFANAKIMLALSENNDSLRYILALGLRTLTLQTGDEYRERIFQKSDGSDLAVLVGSKAIVELHNKAYRSQCDVVSNQERGSDSQESLIEDEVFYDDEMPEDGLATILPDNKARKFLYAPILACTIDHIMAATETMRGGRYILPCLRLMSSDLVIDEIDDFTGSDAIAIGRLVHLAGMLGRKVMISSATIPPSLAEGYFNCYQEGWQLYAKTRNASTAIACAWIDEFNTVVVDNNQMARDQINQEYAQTHQQFIKKRIIQLMQQVPRRRADIIDCQSIVERKVDDEKTKQLAYFDIIAQAALVKHRLHHQTDTITGLKVSFGVIRMANITPCIALTRFLLEYACPTDITLRVMPYHSQQVLLLRHEQEQHLDAVLKHKEDPGKVPAAFENKIIRRQLEYLAKQDKVPTHVLFILVATPVEEIGRDHDFDWAIVEPSSYRSIIQLAGRVRRHREGKPAVPNIGLLQYNWKTIRAGDKEYACYFSQPGYEFDDKIFVNGKIRKASCITHNLKKLVNEKAISERLSAIPRIDEDSLEGFGLVKLEHAVTAHWLKQYAAKGPETLQGYLTQHWYLTALPQALNRFRDKEGKIKLFRYPREDQELYFVQKDEQGSIVCDALHHEPINMAKEYYIQQLSLTEKQQERLWLVRNYRQILSTHIEQTDMSLLSAALCYGELLIREQGENESIPSFLYNDQLGLFKDERR